MNLLFVGRYRFIEEAGNKYAILPYGDDYWKRYLNVFDKITVLAEAPPNGLNFDKSKYALLTNNLLDVRIVHKIENPLSRVKFDKAVKKELTKYIKEADAIVIKMLSNKGIEAIKIATSLNKPFMIEMTGDVRGSLNSHGSIFRKIYAPLLYHKGKKVLRKAPYGMYVSERYLQSLYPIEGKMCGVSDVIIPTPSKEALERRLERIKNFNLNNVNIGMIANYSNNIKGVDTAIKALSILNINAQLYILGQGQTEPWYKIARKYGVEQQIHFPKVLSGIEKVLNWIDTMDLVILPSRTEGLPRCIVEAMSRGCPCITSNVGGLPELIDKKWLHNSDDYKKLAELIELMLSSKENMRSLAIRNFEKSGHFDKEQLDKKRNDFLMEFREYCKIILEGK